MKFTMKILVVTKKKKTIFKLLSRQRNLGPHPKMKNSQLDKELSGEREWDLSTVDRSECRDRFIAYMQPSILFKTLNTRLKLPCPISCNLIKAKN